MEISTSLTRNSRLENSSDEEYVPVKKTKLTDFFHTQHEKSDEIPTVNNNLSAVVQDQGKTSASNSFLSDNSKKSFKKSSY